MTAFQTPEVPRASRAHSTICLYPIMVSGSTGPTVTSSLGQCLAQKDKFLRHQWYKETSLKGPLGNPANPPKVRDKGAGRGKGQTPPAQERHRVVKKGRKPQLKKAA